jgi:hypothetical protein
MKKFAKKLLATAMAACFTVAIMGCENCSTCGVKECSGGKKCAPACCNKPDCCKTKGAAKCAPGCTKPCCKKPADK